MKKLMLIATLFMASFLVTPATHASDFFGGNNGEWKMGPNGPYYDESDWPEWTPMYWMEEFMDSWDDNNWGGSNNNYGGYNGGYGMPNNGYGMSPYGYNQAPYGYAPPYGGYVYPQGPSAPAQ